jgi:hypothetical protein
LKYFLLIFSNIGNIMTTKTQILTAITMIALLIGFSILPAVDAHSGTSSQKLNSATNTICIYSSNLTGVELNGSINQGTTVANIWEGGMDEVSDNTDMNLTRKSTSCSSGEHLVVGYYLSDSADKAITSSAILGVKTIKVSTNTAANMISTGSCTGDWNMNSIANHEFGHFGGLDYDHHYNTSGHTMNEATCTSDWGQIGSGDITRLNGWY